MGALKDFNIPWIMDNYDVPIFFETGTAEGDGVKEALKYNFKEIISVEIFYNQYEKMKEEFKNEDRVNLIWGNSQDVLKRTSEIEDNILFWLDAHFPGADMIKDPNERVKQYEAEKNDELRMPLENELSTIKEIRNGKSDVILVDDLHLYKMQGSLVGDDAYWLKPKHKFSSDDFFKVILEDTHNFQLISIEQGILLPK